MRLVLTQDFIKIEVVINSTARVLVLPIEKWVPFGGDTRQRQKAKCIPVKTIESFSYICNGYEIFIF